MPQEERKFNQFIVRINTLLENNKLNEFEISALKRDAVALQKTDAYESYILQGMLACLVGDEKKSRSFHEKSLAIKDDALANGQYAASLNNLGLYLEAIPYAKRANLLDGGVTLYMNHYIGALIGAMKFNEAKAALTEWKNKFPDSHLDVEDDIDVFDEFLEKEEITDAQTQAIYSSLAHVFQSVPRIMGHSINLLEDGHDTWLDIVQKVYLEPKEIAELNIRISEIIAEKVEPKIMSKIIVRFSSITTGDFAQAV